MSKLYKELNYDTDRVMQPGDPLTSTNFGGEIGGKLSVEDYRSGANTTVTIEYSRHDWSTGAASTTRYNSSTGSYVIGNMTFKPSGSSVTFAMMLWFDCSTADFLAGRSKYVYIELGTGSSESKSGELLDSTGWRTYPMTCSTKTVDGDTVYEYTVSNIKLTDSAVAQYGEYLTTRTMKLYAKHYDPGPPYPILNGTAFGTELSGCVIDDVGYKRGIVKKTLATVDQIPTNVHDADKVISPTGTTVVRSQDNGTATITHPGTSGSLGSPVVTFSSDFYYSEGLDGYAGTTFSLVGPYTVGSWTVWIKNGDTVPEDVGGIMSKEFILADPTGSMKMFFCNGNDIANIQNFDTQNPTILFYSYGGTISGSATMVRNYADVTERMLTESDIVALFSSSGLTINGTTYKAQPAS